MQADLRRSGEQNKLKPLIKVVMARVVVIGMLVGSISMQAHAASAMPLELRALGFPVEGQTHYSDDFGAPRSGGRTHEGNDILGEKLQHLLAAADGTISWMRSDASGLSGNSLSIVDHDGWSYRYMHVNNDSPGTDDGLDPIEWMFAPGLTVGSKVTKGQFVAFLGDSGNAESTSPHLHFEVHRPDGSVIDPWPSLRISQGLSVAGGRCDPGPVPDDLLMPSPRDLSPSPEPTGSQTQTAAQGSTTTSTGDSNEPPPSSEPKPTQTVYVPAVIDSPGCADSQVKSASTSRTCSDVGAASKRKSTKKSSGRVKASTKKKCAKPKKAKAPIKKKPRTTKRK
ncbi:MAG: M23 family metallopeptidase [Actinomycetota bacterium]